MRTFAQSDMQLFLKCSIKDQNKWSHKKEDELTDINIRVDRVQDY